MTDHTPSTSSSWRPGILASIGLLVGMGTVLVAGLALVGIATGLDISIGAHGSRTTALPTTFGGALGLGGVGAGIAAATAAASWFTHRLGAASWPARILMVVTAVLVLGLGGRFVQLNPSYASRNERPTLA